MQKVAYICDNKTNKHRAIMTNAANRKERGKQSKERKQCLNGCNVAIVSTGMVQLKA
jgi:hypothetical protein